VAETAAGSRSEVDLLVGADGASSVIRRRVGVRFEAEDFSYGLGWHIHGLNPAGHVDIRYLQNLSGYIWLFPRIDHLSYGIASGYREATPAEMKQRLLAHVEWQNPTVAGLIRSGADGVSFYAAMIPSLGVGSWDRLRVSKPEEGWALVGDAAGFVDPLTGEGILRCARPICWRRRWATVLTTTRQCGGTVSEGNCAGRRNSRTSSMVVITQALRWRNGWFNWRSGTAVFAKLSGI
jgi:flavin-dependent dehydrogenase